MNDQSTEKETRRDDGLGSARRAFTVLGLAYFTMVVVEYLFSYGLTFIGRRYFPDFAATELFYWLSTSGVIYVFAMPAAWLIMRALPRRPILPAAEDGTPLRPARLGGFDFFIAMLMALGIMQVGNAVGNVINAILALSTGSSSISGLNTIITMNPIATFAVVVVIGPIAEELIFRKVIIDRMSAYGAPVAALMSAMVFGLVHGNIQQYFYAFAVGLFFAFIYLRTGNIRMTILMHMCVNFFGGFVPSMLLRIIDTDELTNTLKRLANATADSAEALKEYISLLTSIYPALMMIYTWSLTMFGLGIVGVYFLIAERKKLTLAPCRPAETAIPREKRGEVIFLNVGMLLFIAVMAAVLALSLFL